MSVYISTIEYITLNGGVLGTQKAVSPGSRCFSLVQSNLHYWGSFYGLCKDLSMNCLSFLFILLVPRLFWSFFWQKMLYNALRSIYPYDLQWSFTHSRAHKQIIDCFYTPKQSSIWGLPENIFQVNSLQISKNLHNSISYLCWDLFKWILNTLKHSNYFLALGDGIKYRV